MILVRSLSMRYESGSVLPAHSHDWGQLVFASKGVMSINVPMGIWVVPTERAVWVPPGVQHSIEMSGAVYMRTLYFHPQLELSLPENCCVLHVPPLLRELIPHTCEQNFLDDSNSTQKNLLDFLLDQLHSLPSVPLALPMPGDPRALRLAELVKSSPENRATLSQLCLVVGAGRRTIERIYLRETGLTFGRWRQQARLLEALRLIAKGQAITNVSLEVGYDSPSAFITMFKNAMGVTPGRYYSRTV